MEFLVVLKELFELDMVVWGLFVLYWVWIFEVRVSMVVRKRLLSCVMVDMRLFVGKGILGEYY